MPTYQFTGKATLRGVVFTVEAKDEAEAREKARNGHIEDADYAGAELSDWDLNAATLEAV